MEKIDLISIVTALVALLIGVALVYINKTYDNLWLSIGSSVIGSGLVILLSSILFERRRISPLDEWGIKNIYKTRSLMNVDCDKSLQKAKNFVDVVGFGLKSYRTELDGLTKDLLRRGVNFRIITMHPESDFVVQREKEEKDSPGQIKLAIEDLVVWAEKLNRESKNGKIEIKGYNCMTIDFYWRVDDDVYVGPYWYGYSSQQTISYKFSGSDNKGFRFYTEYFDKLWNDDSIMKTLVEKRSQK